MYTKIMQTFCVHITNEMCEINQLIISDLSIDNFYCLSSEEV